MMKRAPHKRSQPAKNNASALAALLQVSRIQAEAVRKSTPPRQLKPASTLVLPSVPGCRILPSAIFTGVTYMHTNTSYENLIRATSTSRYPIALLLCLSAALLVAGCRTDDPPPLGWQPDTFGFLLFYSGPDVAALTFRFNKDNSAELWQELHGQKTYLHQKLSKGAFKELCATAVLAYDQLRKAPQPKQGFEDSSITVLLYDRQNAPAHQEHYSQKEGLEQVEALLDHLKQIFPAKERKKSLPSQQ
jgi:hypothetical protein